jgi:peptidoglycan/LPS O-acetylase OafA/YrhL
MVAIAVLGVHFPHYFVEHRFVFLFLFAAILPIVFELTKDWRVDRFLADLSFPLYLVHWPIMMLALNWPKPVASWPGMVPTILSIAAAAMLAVIVERPIDKWRRARILQHKIRRTRPVQALPSGPATSH